MDTSRKVTYNGMDVSAPRSKAYLNARDLAHPLAAVAHRDRIIADWTDLKIQTALGVQFRYSAQVRIRRPWWMPGPLYRRLMRSVVVDTRWDERTQKGRRAA